MEKQPRHSKASIIPNSFGPFIGRSKPCKRKIRQRNREDKVAQVSVKIIKTKDCIHSYAKEDLVQHRLHADGEGLGWTQVGCKQKVSTQKESAETASNLSAHEGRTRSQNSPSPEQYRSTPGIRMALDTELSVPATTLQ
ncbi:hypothetical protein MJO28_017593 [Puccinia striiformis f. sp. tritici]|nr:hypothetical protein MJO28_017593 [Puccinia striiformis f. sp. tritici]